MTTLETSLGFFAALGLLFVVSTIGAFLLWISVPAVCNVYKRQEIHGMQRFVALGHFLLLAAFGATAAGFSLYAMQANFGWLGAAALAATVAALFVLLQSPKVDRVTVAGAPQDQPATSPPAWSRLLWSLPALYVAAAFVAARFAEPLPGLGRRELGQIMHVEGLVQVSLGFLGFLAVARAENRRRELARWMLFLLSLAAFMGFALQEGVDSALLFIYAAAGTYGGALGRLRSPDAKKQLIKRWLLSFVIFWSLALLFAMPSEVESWKELPRVLLYGGVFFLALAAAEIYGLYDRKWAGTW